jgi:hypothetical protein
VTNARSIRTPLVLLLLVLSAVAALSFAGSASAGLATKCGQQVLADWYDNGRIDKLYPLNCYEEAIDEIPSDIGPYVDAEDVITRALQGALHGTLPNSGGCDPSADGSPDDCANLPGGGTNPGNDGQNPGNDGSGPQAQETPDVNTSSPSSVPIPLLVLGGMSLLLLAAGSLGYLSRRRQAAHADELDDSGNPPV